MVHVPHHGKLGGVALSGAAIALLEEPRTFIREQVLAVIVDLAIGFAGWIGFWTARMFDLLASVIVDGLAAAFGPAGRALGELIIGVLGTVNDIVNGLATGTGPFGLFLVTLIWMALTVAILYVLWFIVKLILGRYTPL